MIDTIISIICVAMACVWILGLFLMWIWAIKQDIKDRKHNKYLKFNGYSG